MAIEEITCKEIVEVVNDYLEDRMPPERRLLFEEHLTFCSWCQTYLDQMRETVRLSGGLTEDELSPETREDLLNVFRHWKTQTS
jgi:predicted anti-sigma-YlaC factor YlaD